MPTIFGVAHRITSICVTIIYDLLGEEFLMPRGLDEWTEAITRVTQLGARTHRQRQNHQQFFNTKSIGVVDLDEEPSIEIRSSNNNPVISSITVTPSSVDGGNDASVIVVATDADDDELSYEWSASLGTFDDTSLASTTWTASGSTLSEQTVTLSCVVSDEWAGEVTGTVDITITALPLTIPGQVSTPTVSSSGTASLNVSWSKPSTGNSPITDYDIRYRRSGSSAWTSWSHSGVSRTATIASLDPNVAYEVQIRAENSVGEGSYSSSGTATTQAAVPDQVTGVSLTSRTTSSISISWSQPSSNGRNITDYDVQYRRSGNSTWISRSHSGTSRTSTISGLADNVTYQVQVRAENSVGEGAWSSAQSFRTVEVNAWPRATLFNLVGYWLRVTYTAHPNEQFSGIFGAVLLTTNGVEVSLPRSSGGTVVFGSYSTRVTSIRATWQVIDYGTKTISNIRYWNGSSWVSLSASVGAWTGTAFPGTRYRDATWSLP